MRDEGLGAAPFCFIVAANAASRALCAPATSGGGGSWLRVVFRLMRGARGRRGGRQKAFVKKTLRARRFGKLGFEDACTLDWVGF